MNKRKGKRIISLWLNEKEWDVLKTSMNIINKTKSVTRLDAHLEISNIILLANKRGDLNE